jgi:ribonuclease R
MENATSRRSRSPRTTRVSPFRATPSSRIYRGVAGKAARRTGRPRGRDPRARARHDRRRPEARGPQLLRRPDDPRFVYEIAVPDPARSGLKPAPQPGDKVVVKLGEWRRREQPLVGEITERLGRTHEPRAELLGIFIKHGLEPHFPADVEREAAASRPVSPKDIEGRLDYRQIPSSRSTPTTPRTSTTPCRSRTWAAATSASASTSPTSRAT